ncbi:MAG: LysR family transcriptional regulator [Bacilli bacterium]|nr:LysR family transcriptional regulator [Bacilli bacterium]
MSIYNSYSDFNKYRVFYAVAECLSFSKATEYLHISQPAISHAIKELEEQLETKLFKRENKRISLTEDGEKLLEYVKNAFDSLVAGERALKENDKEITGKVRIGIYSHISTFMLPKLIKLFNSKNPKVKFTVFSSSDIEIKEKLNNRELDIAILHYPIFVDNDKFTEEKLCELESCFFANKYYYELLTQNKNIKKQEVPIILPMKGYIDTLILERYLKNNNIVLKPSYRIYATELKVALVKEGVGICWGSKDCIKKELENEELFEIPFDIECPSMSISIAYDKRYINKASLEFIKLLKKNYKK